MPIVMRRLLCRAAPVLSGCVLLLAGLALPAVAQQGGGGPVPVVVAPAFTDTFVDRVEALGTTRANESVDVTANVTEKLREIRFDDGQQVAEGDVLVVLERQEEEAALASARAALAERRSSFGRAKELESRQFTATATLEERQAALQEAEAQLAVAQARLADREVRAPFSGVVGLRNVSVGQLIEPGDVITTLDDLSVVKLDFSVPSSYLASLRPGLEIRALSPAFSGEVFEGEVRSVATQVDPVTRSVVARAIIPNPDGLLRPGLLMTVTLLKNPRQAVVVPEEALVPRGEDSFLFVVDPARENRAFRRQVEIGARRPGEVEILSGLEPGELVVTDGTMKIQDGTAVEMIAREGETAGAPEPAPAAEAASGS